MWMAAIPCGQAAEPVPAEMQEAMKRLEQQIDLQIELNKKGPRKRFLGGRPTEERFARYEKAWQEKIERVAVQHYPEEARAGKIRGSARMTVTLRPDGTVDAIEMDRSSGHKVLDQAAFRIVKAASPF